MPREGRRRRQRIQCQAIKTSRKKFYVNQAIPNMKSYCYWLLWRHFVVDSCWSDIRHQLRGARARRSRFRSKLSMKLDEHLEKANDERSYRHPFYSHPRFLNCACRPRSAPCKKGRSHEPWNALSALKSELCKQDLLLESNEEHDEALKYPFQQMD